MGELLRAARPRQNRLGLARALAGGDAVAFGNPHFPSRLYRHAYPYNAGQETSVIEGETLKPRQKAKYRNAYVAPLSLDRTKPNGVGPGVVTIGAR